MKGFVFDLDNTLYDRYATICTFLKRDWDRAKPYINIAYSFERAAAHVCHTEALYIDGGWEKVYEQLVHEHFFNNDNIPSYEKVRLFALNGFRTVAVNFDGIHEFLQTLHERGYKLALLTNASLVDYQNDKLDLLGIRKYFDQIVISGEYSMKMCGDNNNKKYQKPGPDIFLHTAELLGVRPEQLYYVGDSSVNDVMGAYASGYTPIWVRSHSPWTLDNKYLPELCVDNVIDILKIID